MKTPVKYPRITLALLALSILNFQLSTVFAQGTAFTYQGRLNDGAGPANGSGAFSFTETKALLFPMRFYHVLSL